MDLSALGLLSSIFMLMVGSFSGIFSKCLSRRGKCAFLWLWIYLLSLNLFPPWGPGSCSFPPSNHVCSLITLCSHLSSTLPSPGSSILKKKKNAASYMLSSPKILGNILYSLFPILHPLLLCHCYTGSPLSILTNDS